uniref:Uncharacterized protein n=1 Tax=Solanum lycopersicum TaxID=4081 RepID=K4CTS2_SOLLC
MYSPTLMVNLKFLTAHYLLMWCQFLSIIATLVCLIFFGENCVPKIWDAFHFTGATTTVFVGFVYSATIVLRDTHGIATNRDRLFSSVMILLVVSPSSVAICSDIYNLFNNAVDVGF